MNPRHLVAAGAGALLVAVAILWGRPAPETPAPGAAAPPPPAARVPDPVGVAGSTAPADGQLATQVLASAVAARYLAPAVPAEARRALAAGDVAGAARALQATADPNALAALAALAGWCRELAAPAAPGADGAGTTGALPAAQQVRLEQLTNARRRARARLADGCAEARLDPAAIAEPLRASAQAGNAASLERAALDGLLPPEQLASAAILGAPRAAFALALDLWGSHPDDARAWLQAAEPHDAEAAAYLAACRLAGCRAAPDPVGGQQQLESAARRGSNWALGLLASPGAGREPYRWLAPSASVSPVPPPEAALPLAPTERYAWATLAARLAADGCFGFDLATAGEALAAAQRVGDLLSPAELATAEARAATLAAAVGGELRGARGCR